MRLSTGQCAGPVRRTAVSSICDGRDPDEAERLVDGWPAGPASRAAAARELPARVPGPRTADEVKFADDDSARSGVTHEARTAHPRPLSAI